MAGIRDTSQTFEGEETRWRDRLLQFVTNEAAMEIVCNKIMTTVDDMDVFEHSRKNFMEIMMAEDIDTDTKAYDKLRMVETYALSMDDQLEALRNAIVQHLNLY